MSTRRTRTQNLCQLAVRERLVKYVKYKASLFYVYFYFFPDSPTEVTLAWNFTHNGSKHALWRKEVPFGGPHDGRQHFGVQIPQILSKMAFYKHVRASANGLKTNDVIEDWRHWLAVARRPSSVYYLQHLGNHCGYVFYNIYNATIMSAGALYSVRKFSFCKIYTVFVGNLFYRLAHKKIPYAVCWKA